MSNIFFDFDGTLINSKKRVYRLFKELCTECDLTEEEYNTLKQTRISQKELLKKKYGYNDSQAEVFHEIWMKKIEEKERIETDFAYIGTTSLLKKLSTNNELYLVTNRQKEDLVYYQIEKLGWKVFFKNLLVTKGEKSKAELIHSTVPITHSDVLIGDTGEDVVCAKKLNIHSIAVCWGTLSKKILLEYTPDFIVERMEDFDQCSFL